MTITSEVWPQQPVDLAQLMHMFTLAYLVDPAWQPPPRFACERQEMPPDFVMPPEFGVAGHIPHCYVPVLPLEDLQQHTIELWQSLPQQAQLVFYLTAAFRGVAYAQGALQSLARHAKLNRAPVPEIVADQITILLKVLPIYQQHVRLIMHTAIDATGGYPQWPEE